MISKLTANLAQSSAYAEQIQLQLRTISEQILQARIQIAGYTQKIAQAQLIHDDLVIALKRQQEENSNYEYKKQKVEIRVEELRRKCAILQEVRDKKQGYLAGLQAKVSAMEATIAQQPDGGQVETLQAEIQDMGVCINKQGITISNLYTELMSNSRQLRSREDQLNTKKKLNAKQRSTLRVIQTSLLDDCNKQNLQADAKSRQQAEKIVSLQRKKRKLEDKTNRAAAQILQLLARLEQMSANNLSLRKQVQRNEQLAQQAKLLKCSVLKIRDNMPSHINICEKLVHQ